ncbi:MAG: DNA alkylation repair protein [Chlorobiales bacterium]|nr:DNA alkylation repair protein [Chlorobiales bacterium]
MMTAAEIHHRIEQLADPEHAQILQRFFKTGPGQYGEGDIFIGIRVPALRALAKEFKDTPLKEVRTVLQSAIHEERLLALLMIVNFFPKGADAKQKLIYDLYLKNTRFINNWDLVDLSAHHIVGAYLHNKDRAPLYKLVRSNSLWERRISIISTYHYIRKNEFADTLLLSKCLLNDTHDLIHKAVGWMLREVGKRHLATEEDFLNQHYKTMPRTMLRYAIEKIPESKRLAYLKGNI